MTNLLHVPSFHSRLGFSLFSLPVGERACLSVSLPLILPEAISGLDRQRAVAAAAAAVDMNMLIGLRGGAAAEEGILYSALLCFALLCSPRDLNFDVFGQSLPL